MESSVAPVRRDLEFFPVEHGGRQLILIRDHLGLVQEGRALPADLYQIMALLDGKRGVRDIQMEFMRANGGLLVSSDEVKNILDHLDEMYLLESERFQGARDRIINEFGAEKVRPCSHCGRSYPAEPTRLKARLDEILGSSDVPSPDGRIAALVAPHIDPGAGERVYGSAYRCLMNARPERVVVLGVGHRMPAGLFCLTEKDFESPFGMVKADRDAVGELRAAGGSIVTPDDFAHRAEHSIEFQLIFLQHLLGNDFTMLPVLCGSVQAFLPEYHRKAYLEKAEGFLRSLNSILGQGETLVVAGVDMSHVGPKFGHTLPAVHLEGRARAHDRALLGHLVALDAESFWQESGRVTDQYNVCGFSALACLLEILPPGEGMILNYEIAHEEATQSAVSFAAAVFLSK